VSGKSVNTLFFPGRAVGAWGSWVFRAFIITQRWRPLRMMMMAMMTGDAKWGQPENEADAAAADAAGWAYVGIGSMNGSGAGKCDGPENSTEQKASAAGPTKAVGVICWSSLLSSYPCHPSFQLLSLSLLLLLLLWFRHPDRWHWDHPRSHSAAWRSASASASAAARRVVIHPRGTVVSAAHNR